jgi:hypothetical protein
MPVAGAYGDMAHGLGDMHLCRGVVEQASRHRPVLEDEYQEITLRPVTSRSAAWHVRWVLPASRLLTALHFERLLLRRILDLFGSESRVRRIRQFLDEERLNALEETRENRPAPFKYVIVRRLWLALVLITHAAHDRRALSRSPGRGARAGAKRLAMTISVDVVWTSRVRVLANRR